MTLGDFGPSWSDLLGGLMIAAVVGVGVLIEMLRRGFRHVRAIDHAVNNAEEGEPTMREIAVELRELAVEQQETISTFGHKADEFSGWLKRLEHKQDRNDARVEGVATDVGRVERKVDEHIAFHRGVEAAKGQA